MIEVYKIFNGKYDEEVTSWLRSRHYESHYDNIYQSRIHSDIRKFNFATNDAIHKAGPVYSQFQYT